MAKNKTKKTKKTKKKSELDLVVAAAEELNEVLGLEPAIDTEDVDIDDLKAKLVEASELITEDDEFTEDTAKVLESIAPEDEEEDEEFEEDEEIEDDDLEEDEEEEEDDDFEEEEEDEEEEDDDLEELREAVESAGKRKDLLKLAQKEEIFAELKSKLPKLKSIKALKGAMLSVLDTEEAEEAEAEEHAEEPKAKSKKAAKAKGKAKSSAKEKSSKPKKKGKSATQACRDFLEKTITAKKGKYTRKELTELAVEEFPDVAKSTIQTILTDGKNPKYNKFPKLLVEDEDGKVKFK